MFKKLMEALKNATSIEEINGIMEGTIVVTTKEDEDLTWKQMEDLNELADELCEKMT